MNWYIAKIVYRIICGEGNHTAQFDEQLRLIKAEKQEEALLKAQLLGSREEETFYNNTQQLVKWQFVNVCELRRLADIIDGAELYSRVEEKDNGDSYELLIHNKASRLEKINNAVILATA
ncbi:MAG TPA: DUF4288 domain-containing protein [Niabella sp.]|nr:DUF4288 domain-containing protein [Niabella sp.]HUM98764.1 DUF4288 domain-containing protein [Chitinophagaceae bacterium]